MENHFLERCCVVQFYVCTDYSAYSIIHIDDGGDQKQRPRYFFLYRQKDMRAIFLVSGRVSTRGT